MIHFIKRLVKYKITNVYRGDKEEMRNISYAERKILICKHLKEGYSYNQSIEIMNYDYDSIKEISKKQRREKRRKKKIKKLFDEEFSLLKNC